MSAPYNPPTDTQVRIKAVGKQELYFTALRAPSTGGVLEPQPIVTNDVTQYFSFTAGTGQHQGLYSVFSIKNDQIMFARSEQTEERDLIYVGLENPASPTPPACWFKFTANAEGTEFRICCPHVAGEIPLEVVKETDGIHFRFTTEGLHKDNVLSSWYAIEKI